GDKLYIPIYRLEQVQRYIGDSDGSLIPLDKLGSAQFEKTKSKVREALKEVAHELLRIYAMRATQSGFKFSPPDEQFKEFEARFPFAETPDQLRAIDETLTDMQSGKIMDRLICGDVGYGKTEVAMRAAYKAALDGKQVAVLVPTTVLALQHELSFKNRFQDTGVRVASVSRFKSSKELKETLTEVKEGKVDILIGTHRILSRDVEFKDLGMVVVDEEQRFGVEHKEKLKKLKVTTAILTLTATPIPRTLHLSLMGLRDISVINTAPVDRLSVRTYISHFEEEALRIAITQEIARGGQVFFIHNRVQSIGAMEERLKKIVPQARIVVAHGQLKEGQLEEKMVEFYSKKADVLLCTTIIESGLDIPSANTIIINRADMFGLAQLYQLRGRVGRSQVRAYCYLLLPEEGLVTDDAKKRLEIIQRFVDLGSGFKVASHDLELRGGGDILGKAQSGHIAAVGYELYTDLLEETIHEIKGEEIEDRFDPEIKIPVPALLPDDYVPDIQQRLGLYKRLSQADSIDKISDLEAELIERFGQPPQSVLNLLELIQIKQLLVHHHIKTLLVGQDRISLDASEARALAPEKILSIVKKSPSTVSITPESKILLRKPFTDAKTLHADLRQFLSTVSSDAASS
ncbi:MAG TPA: transcription-repair coupling factor, partial [Oligoflexia bacterium]|nr:transcription-repair coupling factor [Oligoflexia bacterium]